MAAHGLLDPIAVIGYAVNLPGEATDVESFWNVLCQGRSMRSEIPKDRFDVSGYLDEKGSSLGSVSALHGVLDTQDISKFDAAFFRISPQEASCMDPQHRLMLEASYHAIENAGVLLEDLAGSMTSVFIAAPPTNDYASMLHRDIDRTSKHAATGIGLSMMANRISHFLDCRGPSLVIDTACSSGLYALHLACRSLQSGESTMSIVGGGNLILSPETFMVPLSDGGFLSPDGISYSFDSRANGYSRGEGFVSMVLKPISTALRDGDTIRSVIRSSVTGANGQTPSITQPSIQAQRKVIEDAYKQAGLDSVQTAFIEAHGTGTSVGDPMEAHAIGQAFNNMAATRSNLAVGAVKSNIGHLEGASGLAAVVKTALALERGVIPPNTWFEEINPTIDATKLRLQFPTKAVPWPACTTRQASVNNFGYGGAVSHLVMQNSNGTGLVGRVSSVSTDRKPTQSDSRASVSNISVGSPYLLLLSASDEGGISRVAEGLAKYASRQGANCSHDLILQRLCVTLAKKRSLLNWRSYVVVKDLTEVQSSISQKIAPPVRQSSRPTICFVFTGQGAQYPAMGRDLLRYEVFRASVEAADSFLRSLGCKWSVCDEITSETNDNIHKASMAHPLSLILQVALVDLLRYFKVMPAACVGHSSGEIAAAYAAGALSRESAWRIALFRGRFSEETSLESATSNLPLSMMAVALPPEVCESYIARQNWTGTVSIGCKNSNTNCTLSGPTQDLASLKSQLDADGIFARQLNVNLAYHSSYMEKAAQKSKEELNQKLSPPQSKDTAIAPQYYSTITGDRIAPEALVESSYWGRNMTSPVEFSAALPRMLQNIPGNVTLVEIGPHAVLRRPIQELLISSQTSTRCRYTSVLRQGVSSASTFLELIGDLFQQGLQVAPALCDSLPSGLMPLVDLPSYPFNHSQRHWTSSRLAQLFVNNGIAKNELLGRPELDWNESEPIWRNVIKAAESPWILDHTIDGSSVFPAAGCLTMVLEGLRQLMGDLSHVSSGYHFRNVHYSRVLPTSDSLDGTELRLYMRSLHAPAAQSYPRYSFKIYGLSTGDWFEVCHGEVQAENYQTSHEIIDHLDEEWLSQHGEISSSCGLTVEKTQFYDNIHALGFEYGPAFQNLDNIRFSRDGLGFARVTLRSKSLGNLHSTDVIHPAALDAILHMVFVGQSRGGWKRISPSMASRTKDIWISSKLASMDSQARFEATCKTSSRGLRDFDSDVTVVDQASGHPVVRVLGHRGTLIGNPKPLQEPVDSMCLSMEWRPDAGQLTSDSLQAYVNHAWKGRGGSPLFDIELSNKLVYFFMEKLLSDFDFNDLAPEIPHLRKYLDWITHTVKQRGSWTGPISHAAVQEHLARRADCEPYTRIVLEVGRLLPRILRGEVDPLELLFKDGLADDFYRKGLLETGVRLGEYLAVLSHSNARLRIIEVGAGTGGVTSSILSALTAPIDSQHSSPGYACYHFTDISASFFSRARERLAAYNNVSFKALDISLDPSQQGFDLGAYDIVIAANVLHATPNIQETLQNVKRLLKPGGQLLLSEVDPDKMLASPFVFGLLSGWWQSEDQSRSESPLLTRHGWQDALVKSGFAGINASFTDSDLPQCQLVTTYVCHTATEDCETRPYPPIDIIYHCNNRDQAELACLLQQRTEDCRLHDVASIGQISNKDRVVISLLDVSTSKPFMRDVNVPEMSILQHLSIAFHVIWICTTSVKEADHPWLSVIEAFGRSVSYERGRNTFTSVTFEDMTKPEGLAERICGLCHKLSTKGLESVYVERNGFLNVSRMFPKADWNNDLLGMRDDAKAAVETHDLSESEPIAAELSIATPGLLDSLEYRESHVFHRPLKDNEIDVKVHYAGLNFKDLLVALGQIPQSFFGYDAAGVVVRAGNQASFAVGDRVMISSQNTLATMCRCEAADAFAIPENMDYSVAASLPSPGATAHFALVRVARLQAGETILIHSAAGGVGQMAVQLALLIGAEVFVTVGSDSKRKLLQSLYGLKEDHIFDSRSTMFSSGIQSIKGRHAIDVVLNSLAGELMEASMELLAPFGRFVELGKRDIALDGKLPLTEFDRGISFSAIDLALPEARDYVRRSVSAILDLIQKHPKDMHEPRPLQAFGATETEQAFRLLQSGRNSGKLVIKYSEGLLPITRIARPHEIFNANATYLITGGFGGVGLSILEWMLARGARHLVNLSRSGSHRRSGRIDTILKTAKSLGAKIWSLSCDVSQYDSIREAMSQLPADLPPIRGAIHTAMVLSDAFIESMTSTRWNEVMQPKAIGGWNLHKILPHDLEFFVLLGSVSSRHGNRGASNYAAANAFTDALASHRKAMGLRAISISLPVLRGTGHLVSDPNSLKAQERSGHRWIDEATFLKILEIACARQRTEPALTEIIIGLPIPANYARVGRDVPSFLSDATFQHLFNINAASEASQYEETKSSSNILAEIRGADSDQLGTAILLKEFKAKLARTMSVAENEIDELRPLYMAGVDSLVAVEIRHWFQKQIELEVPSREFLSDQSIEGLCNGVVKKLRG